MLVGILNPFDAAGVAACAATGVTAFALESLLPGTGYDVHVSKLRIKDHGLIRTGAN